MGRFPILVAFGFVLFMTLAAAPELYAADPKTATTEGQPSMIKRAKEAGAVGWIVKPFNATQLVQTAKHLTNV